MESCVVSNSSAPLTCECEQKVSDSDNLSLGPAKIWIIPPPSLGKQNRHFCWASFWPKILDILIVGVRHFPRRRARLEQLGLVLSGLLQRAVALTRRDAELGPGLGVVLQLLGGELAHLRVRVSVSVSVRVREELELAHLVEVEVGRGEG